MKHPTSIRLPDLTTQQLAALIKSTGMTQSEVISTAIDRMYQEENMNAKQLIDRINRARTADELREIGHETNDGKKAGVQLASGTLTFADDASNTRENVRDQLKLHGRDDLASLIK